MQQWRFGCVENETNKRFIVPVKHQDVDHATLIQQYIFLSTTIVLNKWTVKVALESCLKDIKA